MTPVRMADCTGLWRRTLLIDTDGTDDNGTDVRWLQGITAFVDLRKPQPRDDLSKQDGFAGWLSQRGDVFEWGRFVNLQPPGPHPDAGRMSWSGATLVEIGVHADYVEHWVREVDPVGPCWAVTLAADTGEALLLRVGDLFGWAEHGGGGREISLGTVVDSVNGPAWIISDSSSPAREGQELFPESQEAGELIVRDTRWHVKQSEGNMKL